MAMIDAENRSRADFFEHYGDSEFNSQAFFSER
jgi:hypothetical protein